jgi:eukaryotic-like serine/threonine-protein kinase
MKECPSCSACFDDTPRFCSTDGTELVPSLSGERALDGRWRLEHVVGVGRQGTVYDATDVQSGTRALVKTILPTLFYEPGVLDRLLADMDRARALRHANAARVFAAGRLGNGGAYVVSEYLEGRSLKQILAEENPLDIDRVASLAAEAADALGAAHAAGLLHRDVKPDNIIVARDGERETAKLVDFGIARWASGRGGSTVTTTGSLVIRMPHYSSPEQCRGEEVDARSDIYSLGCVVYQMLTGRVPFDAPSPMAVLIKHVTEPPEPPAAVRPEVPASLDRSVLHALEKAPADRYQSAGEFARDLREAAAAMAAGAIRNTGATTAALAPTAGAQTGSPAAHREPARRIPAPPEPVPMRIVIVDSDDESNVSRKIAGFVHDFGENGMRLETGTIATGQLSIIRDHTTAFKNRLELEVDLPGGTIRPSGFAAWYKPAPDGVNWNVGFYIRDMSSADWARYNDYLKRLAGNP